MARLFPRGVFSRNRMDWSLEGLMTGAEQTVETYPLVPAIGLNNNTTSGYTLAVYSLTAWSPKGLELVSGDIASFVGLRGSAGPTPMLANTPPLDGQIQRGNLTNNAGNYGRLLMRADASVMRSQSGVPLITIAPGQTLILWPVIFGSNAATALEIAVAFTWARLL